MATLTQNATRMTAQSPPANEHELEDGSDFQMPPAAVFIMYRHSVSESRGRSAPRKIGRSSLANEYKPDDDSAAQDVAKERRRLEAKTERVARKARVLRSIYQLFPSDPNAIDLVYRFWASTTPIPQIYILRAKNRRLGRGRPEYVPLGSTAKAEEDAVGTLLRHQPEAVCPYCRTKLGPKHVLFLARRAINKDLQEKVTKGTSVRIQRVPGPSNEVVRETHMGQKHARDVSPIQWRASRLCEWKQGPRRLKFEYESGSCWFSADELERAKQYLDTVPGPLKKPYVNGVHYRKRVPNEQRVVELFAASSATEK